VTSPLLANIYLNDLDRFIEDTLVPAYTNGTRRRTSPEYNRLNHLVAAARRRGDTEELRRLNRERRQVASVDGFDPSYRRLRFVRYADDFLLGFAGPKDEAEAIRDRLAEYLGTKLKLALSMEKTLITHAVGGKARFLGYEITVTKANDLVSANGMRATNGNIGLLMPRRVADKVQSRFSRRGKIVHQPLLVADTDYSIVQRYQAVLRGIYNYYCLAANVSNRSRMGRVKWMLETSLTKSLAHKHKCSVSQIYAKYRVAGPDGMMLRVVVERPDKKPLVAVFGGFPIQRKAEGLGTVDFQFQQAWFSTASTHSEVVHRLLAGRCELCGAKGPVQMHHIRKLADIDRPGRRPKEVWERIMAARKRKTLAVCDDCHQAIHAGEYDGPTPRGSLESRMR
jgi:hypothetical protein